MMKFPPLDADWGVIAQFALTFNGYQFVNGGPVELDALWDKVVVNPLDASIDELRACLFFLQRAGRFCGDEGSAHDLEEAREIIKLIKGKYENQS